VANYIVTLMMEAPIKPRKDGVDGINVRKTVNLPYLPRVGDRLAMGAGGDFITVDELLFYPPDRFEVWCEQHEFAFHPKHTKQLQREGWEEFE